MSAVNFCAPIFEVARQHPARLALRVPRRGPTPGLADSLSYGELVQAIGRRQGALRAMGLSPGQRALVFVRPSLDLYVLLLAMLAEGIVPVMVERGMSRARLRTVLSLSGAGTAIGERSVMRLWWLFPALWRMRRWATDGQAVGVSDSRRLLAQDAAPQCRPMAASAHGIITYTSGSTGLPKGADRTHGSLRAQHHAIRAHWPDRPGDIDLPSFPVLVLHNLCCGISTVLPDTDLAFPAKVEAHRVLHQVEHEGVTRLSGSPAYFHGLTRHAVERGLTYGGVRSIAIGGSTLTLPLLKRIGQTFPQAEVLVVYGSTEAEPISEVSLDTLVADWWQHPGHLVGHPARGAQVCMVEPDARLRDGLDVDAARCPVGTEGEILVAGEHVLSAYIDNPAANGATKVPRSDGLVWHRTGDMGFFDAQGRIWLTGRLADRVVIEGRACSPFPLEKAIDALPGIERSALMEHRGQPVLFVQGRPDDPLALRAALAQAGLRDIAVHPLAHMPVDIRHNSKLDRIALRALLKRGALRA